MRPWSRKLAMALAVLATIHFTLVECEAARKKKSGSKLEPVIIFGDGESNAIEFVERGLIFIAVTIPPGKTGYFMVDTGWSGSGAMRSDLVKAMGLEKYKNRKVMDVGKTFTATSWRVKEVRFGGNRYDDLFAQTYKGYDKTLARESEKLGSDVLGILSIKFMQKFLTRIDFDSGLISFEPIPEKDLCSSACNDEVRELGEHPSCIRFTYIPSRQNIRIETYFNDLPYPIVLALDTGATHTPITEEILIRLGKEISGEIGFQGETEKMYVGAAGGVRKFKEEEVEVDSISVGEARLENFELDMLTGTTISKMRFSGLLGMDFLRNFNISLDLEHKCLVLAKNANYYKYEGDRLWRERDFAGAAEAYRKTIAIKDCPDHRVSLGRALARTEEYDLALAEFRSAAEMDDTIDWPHREIGVIHHKQKKYGEAEDAFRKALTLDADDSKTHKALAALYADQGLCEEAAEACRPVLDGKPEDGKLRVTIGKLYQAHGCYDQAITSYREALAKGKAKWAWPHLRIGTAHQDKGELEEALLAYEKALEIDPDYFWSHMRIGLIREQLGRLDDAADAYTRACKIEGSFCEADLFLFCVNAERGLVSQAKEELARSLDREEDHDDPLLKAAGLRLLERGDEDAVFSAVKSDEDECEAHYYLGRFHQIKGDGARAMDYFRKAAEEIFPSMIENAAARYELSHVHEVK
ncbi:tetratricopeptide repeat protein [Thermodesulfobacteriota bacterium]